MLQRRDGSPRDWHSARPRCASIGRHRKRRSNKEQLLSSTKKWSLARIREKQQPTILVADDEETGLRGQRRGKPCHLLNTTDGLLVDVAVSLSVCGTDADEVWDVRNY